MLASRVTPPIVSLGQRSPEMLADIRQALAAGSADDEEDELTAASNADNYDPEFEAVFQELVTELDPPAAT